MSTPQKCKYCGAPRQLLNLQTGSGGSQYNRYGWYHYGCGARWHSEHKWAGQPPYCKIDTQAKKIRKLQAEVRRLRKGGA